MQLERSPHRDLAYPRQPSVDIGTAKTDDGELRVISSRSSAQSSKARSRSRAVIVAGLLLTFAFVALSGLRMWRNREADIEQWKTHLSATSLTLAEHVRQSFTAADLVLKSITDYVNDAQIETEADLRKALATEKIFEMLRNRASSAPQVSVATIVALNGDIVNFSRNWPPPPINLTDRDYFKAHISDRELDVYLSAPVRSRGAGTWTFFFARKIRSPSGRVIGLTLAGLESEFFSNFYRRITQRQPSEITLLRADGTLLAQHPMRDENMGASFVDHPAFRKLLAKGHTSSTVTTSTPFVRAPGAATPHLVAIRKVNDYPVVVDLALSHEFILSDWSKAAQISAILTLLVAGLIIGMTAWIARLLQRQEESLVAVEYARRAAEEAGNAKAEFLAHMSHEIRTPLNAVIGMSSLLIETRLDAEQKKYAAIIGRSGEHLLSLLNNVLDLSRLDAGHIDVERGPIDLADLMDGTIETARSLKQGKNLDIAGSIDADVPPIVIGDLGRVAQVVLNLLGNAVKYTSAGQVRFQIALVDRSCDHVRLRFSVTDTGIGISTEDQARLFEPFERGRQRVAKEAGGSGLGLSISRRTVELMGGKIGVASQQGSGSTFWFELPFGIGREERSVSCAASIVPPTRSLRVLVAEDTPANQALVRAVLEKMGHTVQIVGDGGEAVEALRHRNFDVVLMDVQMPIVDGYEATRRIRNLPDAMASIPIIGVTAFARDADRLAVLGSGMNEYLSKPFRLSTLAAALRKVTEGSSPAPEDVLETEGSHAVQNFDANTLDSLLAVVGAKTFKELIDEFMTSLDTLLKNLETAIAARDCKAIRNIAHRLVGVVGQYGGKAAAEAARTLEFAPACELACGARDLLQQCRGIRISVAQWLSAQEAREARA